jgi:hypothetical protein
VIVTLSSIEFSHIELGDEDVITTQAKEPVSVVFRYKGVFFVRTFNISHKNYLSVGGSRTFRRATWRRAGKSNSESAVAMTI